MNMIHKFLNPQSCWDPIADWGAASVSELFPRAKQTEKKLAIEFLDFSFFPLGSFYKFFSRIGFP